MKFLKEHFEIIILYFVLSISIWIIRATLTNRGCEKMYMDFVFPITFLHCERK